MNSLIASRRSLAGRLKTIRNDRFGETEADVLRMAEALGLPLATWRNFEEGVVMPAEVLIRLIEVTRVSSHWLLTGEGDRYKAELGTRFVGRH